jgi:ketosteroid isomerase-like protein
MKHGLLIILSVATFAAAGVAQKVNGDRNLESLVNSERAFARASLEKSTKDAFLAYLAPDAILFRPHPVAGRKYTEENPGPETLLTWEPTFADLSASADMGYTTGPWEIRKERNPADKPVAFGHFVSVWKKQPDGSWKVVIDTGIAHARPTSAPAFETPHEKRLASAGSVKRVNVEAEKGALLNADQEFSERS